MPNENKQFNITDPQKLEDIKKSLEEIITFDKFELAFNISNGLRFFIDNTPGFNKKYQNLYQEYKKIIIQMRWTALHLLEEKEIIELFKEYFVEIFDIKFYNIQEKLRTKMMTILVREDRDKLKKSIQNALNSNQQKLTSQSLNKQGRNVEPTVANWILDYNINLGTNVVNKTKQVQYFFNSINTKSLPEQEKEKIKILFNIYEKLKLSSLYAPGLEENIPVDEGNTKGILTEDRFEPIENEHKIKEEINWATNILLQADIPEFIKKSIRKENNKEESSQPKPSQPVTLPVKDIKEPVAEKAVPAKENIEQKFQKQFHSFLSTPLITTSFQKQEQAQKETGKKLNQLKNKFYHSINEKKVEDSLAVLFAICENGQIREMFEKDERFVKFWGGWLARMRQRRDAPAGRLMGAGAEAPQEEKFTNKDLSQKQNLLDASNISQQGAFTNDPADQKYLAMFFKYILEKRLGLKPEQAVLVGVILGNLARKSGELEYQEVAFGDEEVGEFRWNI